MGGNLRVNSSLKEGVVIFEDTAASASLSQSINVNCARGIDLRMRNNCYVYDAPCWMEIKQMISEKLPLEFVEGEIQKITSAEDVAPTAAEILQVFYRLCKEHSVMPTFIKLKKKNYIRLEEKYEQYMKYRKNVPIKEKDYCSLHGMSMAMIANAEIDKKSYYKALSIRGILLLEQKKYMGALVDLNRALVGRNILSKKKTQEIEKHRNLCVSKIRLNRNPEFWVSFIVPKLLFLPHVELLLDQYSLVL